MTEVLIPLTSFTLSEDTAVFFRKKRSDGDEREEKNVSACPNYGAETRVHSTIFDVLDTNRPPDLPTKWLHPPGRLGSFSWSSVKTVGKGHPNVANTCFLNATVQALAYCTPFAEDCLNGRHASRCERHSNSQLCGFCYFERHIRHVLKSDRPNEPFARWNITLLQLMKKEIRMNQGYGGWYGAQNCAHEWLVQFLDFLIKYDLPPQLQKDFEFGRIRSADMATSYLHQLFSGCIKESKICRACNKASARYELNTCFRVPLHQTRSVTKALRATFESELLTGSNRPLCEGCGVPRDKAACRAIHRPPNVLILLLQRTEFNPSCHTMHRHHSFYSSHRHVQKNSVRMEVPLSLTLDPYISEDGRRLFATSENDDNRYDFVSSVNHSGTAGFGHYWAIVRAPDGHFYKLDDEYRSHVSSAALAEQLSSAYLLFYLRRRPVPLSTLANENPQTAPDICVPSASPWTMDLFLDVVTRRDAKPKDANSLPLQISSPVKAASSSTRQQEVAPVAPTSVIMERLSTPLSLTITKSSFGEKTPVEGQTPWTSLLYAPYRRNVRRPKLIRQTLAWGRQRQLDKVIIYSSILKYRHHIRPPLSLNKESRVSPRVEPVPLPQEDNEAFSDTSEYSLTIPLTDTPSTPPPTSSNQQTRGKTLSKPFTLENRLYKPHDVTSQYGSQRSAVEFWDDHETAPQSIKSTELQSKMESIQASLVPRSSRRSREDQAYDRGRQKKVKNAAVNSDKCSTAPFDFNEALRSASSQKHPTTGPRQQRFQKKQRFKRKKSKT